MKMNRNMIGIIYIITCIPFIWSFCGWFLLLYHIYRMFVIVINKQNRLTWFP